jgi:peroxiredoxin
MRRAVALVLALGATGLLPATARAGEPERDSDFDLFDLDGNLFRLKALRTRESTRLVAVDFFSTACEPCRKSLPEWERAYIAMSAKGLEVVVVALPAGDDRDAELARLRAWFKEHPVPFRVVYDRYQKVAIRYGVADRKGASLPQAFLLDPAGKLVLRSARAEDVIVEARDRLLGKGKEPAAKP